MPCCSLAWCSTAPHAAARPQRRVVLAAGGGGGGAGGAGGAGSSSSSASSSSSSTRSSAPNPGLGLKAVWVGAEALGDIIGAQKRLAGGGGEPGGGEPGGGPAAAQQALSREEALAAIKADYETDYFVSGRGAMAAYAPSCYFADPFAGFEGTARFKKNVSNLGGLLSDVQLELLGWEERPRELVTKWRFSALLDLPWRPRLAAAGGTTHVFDPDTGLVVKHIESWDVDPARVVRSLLRPTAKVPTTFWEVVMQSLHDGDALGVWFCLSSGVLKVAAPASAALLLLHAVRGEGLGGLEAATYLGAVAGLLTEMYKVVKSIGGEGG